LNDLNLKLNPVSRLDFEAMQRQEQSGVVFSGGGVLNEFYEIGWNTLEEIKSQGLSVLLLPSTVSFRNVPAIPFSEDDVIFLRDKPSFHACKKLTSSIHLSHDLVFYPSREHWDTIMKKGKSLRAAVRRLQTLHRATGKRRSLLMLLNQKVRLNFFREDAESTGRPSGLTFNTDCTKALGKASQDSWEENHIVVSNFLNFLSMFKEVQTDRLHGAIACHTLGIKCELSAGAYWKNRAVFDHSLKNAINSNVTLRPE